MQNSVAPNSSADTDEQLKTLEANLLSASTPEQKTDAILRLAKHLKPTDVGKALSLSMQAIGIAEAINYQNGYANALSQAASCHFKLGQYAPSLEKAYQAFNLFSKLGDVFQKCVTVQTISSIQLYFGEHEKAISLLLDTLDVFEKSSDHNAYATALLNLGNGYFYMKDYPKALEFFMKVLTIRERTMDMAGIATVSCNIGAVYQAEEDYEAALAWTEKSLQLSRQAGDIFTQIASLVNLGEYHTHLDNNEKAIRFLLESIRVANMSGDTRYLWASHQTLAVVYKKIGDYEKALTSYERFMEAKEKNFGGQVEQKVKAVEIAFEVERAKRDIEISEAKEKIKTLEEIVTMCAWSGKIRFDGRWVKTEEYLQNRFGVKVSHGISEEAAELFKAELKRKNR